MHIKAIKEPTATNKRPDSFESISWIRTKVDEQISCNFNNMSDYLHAAEAQLYTSVER